MSIALLILLLVTVHECTASSNKGMDYIDNTLNNLLDGVTCNREAKQQDRCTTGADCNQVTCSANLSSEPVTLTATVQRCGDPVTIATHIKSSDSQVDWSYKFTTSDRIPIPGFYYQHAAVVVGAFLYSTLNLEDSDLSVNISFQYGTNTTTVSNTEILTHVFPFSRKGCWFLVWWNEKTNTVKMSIIVAMAIFLVFVFFGCCCCFCLSCKRKKKRRRTFEDIQSMKVRARYIHLKSIPKGHRNPNFQGRGSVQFTLP